MYDGAAREIQRPELRKPAAPQQIRDWTIDQYKSEDGKEHQGAELHPFREGPRNKSRRNGGKHKLKDPKRLVRNRRGIDRMRSETDSLQAEPFPAADQAGLIRPEHQAVTRTESTGR